MLLLYHRPFEYVTRVGLLLLSGTVASSPRLIQKGLWSTETYGKTIQNTERLRVLKGVTVDLRRRLETCESVRTLMRMGDGREGKGREVRVELGLESWTGWGLS